MHGRRHARWAVWLLIAAASGLAAEAATAQTYDEYLDNGSIRIGVEVDAYGGAITYLSLSGETRNLINNYDRGRQVQQSYYAGQDVDRTADGQHSNWSPWPWNPIQVGDAYGHSATVPEVTNTGSEIYVKTIPLLWDMNNEPAECTFETWITLALNTAHVRNRVTINRTDDLWTEVSRHQELPAVYTIGDLGTLKTFEGADPFTGAPMTEIVNSGPPWAYWGDGVPTEKWAALLDESDWGVGVYNGDTELFVGGYAGPPGGGEFDFSTGYISPLGIEMLGKDSVLEYEYDLIVGEVEHVRAFAYNAEGYADYDGDGLTFDEETQDLNPEAAGIQNPFDPIQADSTGDNAGASPDGTPDGENDWDGDGLSNAEEFLNGTSPLDELNGNASEAFPESSSGTPLLSGAVMATLLALLVAMGTLALRSVRDSH